MDRDSSRPVDPPEPGSPATLSIEAIGTVEPLLSRRQYWLALALLAALLGPSAGFVARELAREHGAIRPEPHEGDAFQLHQAFLDRARQGDIQLLFLGDSITAYWEGKDGDGRGPFEIWERHFAPRRAANFGVGGDRTQHVLWRIGHGEVDGIRPRVVVLEIGTNNLEDNTPEEIAEGIAAIVATLKLKLPDSKILLMGIFPRGERPGPLRDRIRDVNARIKALDDGGATARFLDIGPRFLNEDGTIPKDVMPDFVHLSRKGYRIWADAMEPVLWDMLDAPTAQVR